MKDIGARSACKRAIFKISSKHSIESVFVTVIIRSPKQTNSSVGVNTKTEAYPLVLFDSGEELSCYFHPCWLHLSCSHPSSISFCKMIKSESRKKASYSLNQFKQFMV